MSRQRREDRAGANGAAFGKHIAGGECSEDTAGARNLQSLADARAEREARFLIARRCSEFAVFERGDDGLLTEVHGNCISREAAERLRRDLIAGRCPFSLEAHASGYDPGDYVARCYDTASRIVPLLDGVADAWSVALRIAHAEPWSPTGDDSHIPF